MEGTWFFFRLVTQSPLEVLKVFLFGRLIEERQQYSASFHRLGDETAKLSLPLQCVKCGKECCFFATPYLQQK